MCEEKEEELKQIVISKKLKSNATRNWLKKRYSSTTYKDYLMNQEELIQNNNIESLFRKFDTDHSNGLDMQELFKMFKENGINLHRKIIKELFRQADADGNGAITLQEFKQIMTNKPALESNILELIEQNLNNR